jgi:RNA polymerase sigma factor (TIGR02999 family)
MSDVTQLLQAVSAGDPKAAEELLPLIYEELRRLAARKMAGEAHNHTLQPTALVHEAWLRLNGPGDQTWQNRAHFFGAAGEAMRRILVERARRRQAAKRGAGVEHVDADEVELVAPMPDGQLLDLNAALEKFTVTHPRKAELVKLRYFVGLSFPESAEVLGIAVPTAKQWWAFSRAWLAVEMQGSNPK